MKSKGRRAWLISWEGHEFDERTRCKIVAVLPPQFGDNQIRTMLPFLYCATYPDALCGKMEYCISSGKDRMLKMPYSHKNVEITYGLMPKEYLSARKVKDLRCVEVNKDWTNCTMYWTELQKYIMIDDSEVMRIQDHENWLKQVQPENERVYSHSIREELNQAIMYRNEKKNRQT